MADAATMTESNGDALKGTYAIVRLGARRMRWYLSARWHAIWPIATPKAVPTIRHDALKDKNAADVFVGGAIDTESQCLEFSREPS